MKRKGELNFLLVQLFVLWNFSQGYLRPCTNTSLGAPNGTTVYAKLEGSVSVLFCMESETTINTYIKILEPLHRAGWRLVTNTKVGTEREGRVVTNITINNVQQQDLNVTFFVKIFTDLHADTGWTNDEWLIFTFILQKPASIRLCNDSSGCSPNGTNVDARVGESAHVVFCVTSDVTIHSRVFINYSRSRSGWYPPKLSTKPPHEQNNNVEVKFEKEENKRRKIIIKIKNVGVEDFKSSFSVKIMSERHALDSKNNECVFLMFQLQQEEPIHSRSTSKSEDLNTMAASTSANIPGGLSVDTIASAVMTTAEVIVDTANGTSTLSKTSTMMATAQVTNAKTPTTAAPQPSLQITKFSVTTSFQPAQTRTQDLMTPRDIVHIAPYENNMILTCVARGNPEPEITILHNNIPIQTSSRGEESHVVQNITCRDSGVYMCRARNTFNWTQIQKTIQVKRPDKIESFIIQQRQSVFKGSIAKMICTAAKCSEPLTMKIVDDTGTVKKKVIQNESLIHEIRNVQCSDIGTYFCRVDTENGTTLEEQLDLNITHCAPQMCRGENKTKTVHAVVGQSLNVSVCIVSYYTLSCQNPWTYRQVQVSLTPRTPGSLYYTVTITISDIQEQDRGNKTIRLSSGYSTMTYTINLQVDTTTSTTAISTLPRPSRATTTESPAENRIEGTQLTTNSESGINVLYIGLPFAAVIVIVIFILGVIIYRKKGGAWFRTRKARTDDAGSTNEGEYANLKELDSATSPVIEEQEPVTSLTRDGGQELASDFSDQDSGRFLSDQGLVYLSIAHVANSNKNKKKKQERKTADKSKNKGRKKDRDEEPVEYTTIDFEKSGKQVISEEEEQKQKDEEKQQNELADKKEESEKSEEKQ